MKRSLIIIIGFVIILFICLFIFDFGFRGIHGNIAGFEDLELESIGKEALGELGSFNLNARSFVFLSVDLVVLLVLLWLWFRFKKKNGQNK